MPTNQEPFKLVSADNQSGSASPVGTRMAPFFVARKHLQDFAVHAGKIVSDHGLLVHLEVQLVLLLLVLVHDADFYGTRCLLLQSLELGRCLL